jgi:hypothetical protein
MEMTLTSEIARIILERTEIKLRIMYSTAYIDLNQPLIKFPIPLKPLAVVQTIRALQKLMKIFFFLNMIPTAK